MKVIVILCMILLISACALQENTQTIENKGVWKTLTPMQTERTEVEVVLANEQLYVIGGFEKEEGETSKVEIFSPKTGWSFGPSLPQPIHHTAAVVIANTIYVMGGYTDGWTPVNSLYSLNIDTNEWEEKAPMLTARGALEAGVINGKIYVVGGKADKILGTLERYDPATDWKVSSLLENFGKTALIVLSGYGVGADTAARILRNMVNDEVLYKQIYEAERQYVMTRGFWDS